MYTSITKDEQDLKLIDRIISGDQKACRMLIERHKSYAFTIAQRILDHQEEAEEAAQDAFIKALRSLSKFNREAKFSTWLYRIVFNTAVSYKRKRKVIKENIDDHQFSSMEAAGSLSSLHEEERQFYLQLAMNKLMPDDVTMLTLFYLKEFSLEEMEQVTGIAANTAKVKVHRARKRLAVELQKILKNEVRALL